MYVYLLTYSKLTRINLQNYNIYYTKPNPQAASTDPDTYFMPVYVQEYKIHMH